MTKAWYQFWTEKTTATAKSSSNEKLMCRVTEPQMKLGELAIADIKLDPKSRDDIPPAARIAS